MYIDKFSMNICSSRFGSYRGKHTVLNVCNWMVGMKANKSDKIVFALNDQYANICLKIASLMGWILRISKKNICSFFVSIIRQSSHKILPHKGRMNWNDCSAKQLIHLRRCLSTISIEYICQPIYFYSNSSFVHVCSGVVIFIYKAKDKLHKQDTERKAVWLDTTYRFFVYSHMNMFVLLEVVLRWIKTQDFWKKQIRLSTYQGVWCRLKYVFKTPNMFLMDSQKIIKTFGAAFEPDAMTDWATLFVEAPINFCPAWYHLVMALCTPINAYVQS